MRARPLASLGALAVAMAIASLVVAPVTAQTANPRTQTTKPTTKTSARTGTLPRTPDGQPDLQGVWDFRTVTPLERPGTFAGKAVLTDEEAAVFEKETAARTNADRRDDATQGLVNGAPGSADVARAYNQFWYDRGTRVVSTKRTSLVVDPPDGKIPPLTPEAEKRRIERAAARERPAAGPEDRSVAERCILGFNSGPPVVPGGYNQNLQLLQTRDYVVIVNEMVHNARIIPLDGRQHANIRQWVGDSRGRWEGKTLVVDTINFYDQTALGNSGPNMHLIERFTRVDDATLLYEFTVSDPTTWTRPWTAQVPMTKSEDSMFEYACHEGNYGMFGILNAARALEKGGAEAAKKSSK
jgi:hypothetical protein